MEWMRFLGLCVLTASLMMILRQMNAPAAAMAGAAFGVMLLLAVLPQIMEYAQMIRSFLSRMGVREEYYAIMLKAMGISLVTQIASTVCSDMGAPSAAKHAQLCGRLALLGVSVPVFLSLAQMAADMLS